MDHLNATHGEIGGVVVLWRVHLPLEVDCRVAAAVLDCESESAREFLGDMAVGRYQALANHEACSRVGNKRGIRQLDSSDQREQARKARLDIGGVQAGPRRADVIVGTSANEDDRTVLLHHDRLEAEYLTRRHGLMAIFGEFLETRLDVRAFGADAFEPAGRSAPCRGDRLETLPPSDLRQHVNQTLRLLELVHDQIPLCSICFRNIDFVHPSGHAAQKDKPLCTGTRDWFQCPSVVPCAIAALMEASEIPSLAE